MLVVQKLQRHEYLGGVKARGGGSEQTLLGAIDQELEQVAARHVLHDEVQKARILKRAVRLHDEGCVEGLHELALAHDVVHLVQPDQLHLLHQLDAARGVGVGDLAQVHRAGHAKPQLFVEGEVLAADRRLALVVLPHHDGVAPLYAEPPESLFDGRHRLLGCAHRSRKVAPAHLGPCCARRAPRRACCLRRSPRRRCRLVERVLLHVLHHRRDDFIPEHALERGAIQRDGLHVCHGQHGGGGRSALEHRHLAKVPAHRQPVHLLAVAQLDGHLPLLDDVELHPLRLALREDGLALGESARHQRVGQHLTLVVVQLLKQLHLF
mmetsp:Transcript_44700/g.71748  ORF Transcript_44700/g.71748 Transcript_44700/m.71748 type:complete len:323 (-) Transcript_44700:622-1590(-)